MIWSHLLLFYSSDFLIVSTASFPPLKIATAELDSIATA